MLVQLLEKLGRRRIIIDRNDELYLERYYLLFPERFSKAKWLPFNILLHHFCASDPGDLHDHPWSWCSVILKGGYHEETPNGIFWRGAGSVRMRRATARHRLIVDRRRAGGETWSLFIVGKRSREWGFVKQGQWVQWQEYLSELKAQGGDR